MSKGRVEKLLKPGIIVFYIRISLFDRNDSGAIEALPMIIPKKYAKKLIPASVLVLGCFLSARCFLPYFRAALPHEGAFTAIVSGLMALAVLLLAIRSKSRIGMPLLFFGYGIVFFNTVFICFLDGSNPFLVKTAYLLAALFWVVMHLAYFIVIWDGGMVEKTFLFIFLLIVDALLSWIFLVLNNLDRAFGSASGFEPDVAIMVFPAIFLGTFLAGTLISYGGRFIYSLSAR
jgi:hypothetical protein